VSRAVLVEGRAEVGLDGEQVGTLHGRGDALALDVPSLLAALRLARAAGPSRQRTVHLQRLASLGREVGVRFEMSVRGRAIARVRMDDGKPLELRVRGILRSLLPG